VYKKFSCLLVILLFIISCNSKEVITTPDLAKDIALNLPDGIQLRIGSTIPGSLTQGGEYWHIVTAEQNGLLVVRTLGDTDTILTAYDSEMNILSTNDDGPDEPNASIIMSVKKGITYLYKLTGFDETAAGSYDITAYYYPVIQLRDGVSHNGRISDWDYQFFSYTADRNGTLVVETEGPTDTYLYFFDEDLVCLGYNDDGAGVPNDRLFYNVESKKTYYIEVGAYEFGPYTVFARLE